MRTSQSRSLLVPLFISVSVTVAAASVLLMSDPLTSLRLRMFTYRVQGQLASLVGVSATVPENRYNRLAQELSEYEQRLQARETEIAAREATVERREERVNDEVRIVAWFVAAIGVLMTALIALNFYLDWKRTGVIRIPIRRKR